MNSELRRACVDGKTASEGGMNLPELRKYAISKGLVSRKDAMTYSRQEIEQLILNNVEQSGGGEIEQKWVYRDIDENDEYNFRIKAFVFERRDRDGKLHSTLGRPARIWRKRYIDYLREWYKHGKLHRKGKPAAILTYYKINSDEVDPHTRFDEKVWYNEGNLVKGIVTETKLVGNKRQEIRRVNEKGELDSFDGKPALVNLVKVGTKIIHEAPGELTIRGPVRRVSRKIWYKNGQKHREGNKPAVINYDPRKGKVVSKEYWVNGRKIKHQKIIKSV